MQTNLHHIHKIQLFAYLNVHGIGHLFVVVRKWIIIIWAKYVMFPLFQRAHKQMRHQQFIARTITLRQFPTVGPGLAARLVSASELGGSHLRIQTTTTRAHTHTSADHTHYIYAI